LNKIYWTQKTPPKVSRFLFFYLSTLRGAYHSRLGTSKSASVSLYNLIRNIVDKIGQNIITEASFDIQINKLLVRADDKKKNTEIVVPKVETKLENGHTTITVSPLTPSNTFELQQCLEQVKQYVDFIHSNYPSATIHYMDALPFITWM
jgi:hypothetical protein